jgi:hypothetical protein
MRRASRNAGIWFSRFSEAIAALRPQADALHHERHTSLWQIDIIARGRYGSIARPDGDFESGRAT